MTPNEIIKWLRECSQDGPRNCKECPYNKEPYEAGCGKLLSDAALLIDAIYSKYHAPTVTVSFQKGELS